MTNNPIPKRDPNRSFHRKHFGPKFSEGSRQLWLVLFREKQPMDWLGRVLALGKGVANRFLYGVCQPELETSYKIFDKFGIEPRLFLLPPTKRFAPPLVKREGSRALWRAPAKSKARSRSKAA